MGLFVPLMDNDSAHHANIALRMYLTGDYVNLIDFGKDYLDKPHLHFWLCALSYEIFGVTTFAYKFPSLLFTIGGTYSIYRIGKILYDTETGKLAALIAASAFAYILANNDVRMDAILTSCIAFATWQLLAFIQHKKFSTIVGSTLGLALGFSTKGHIAVFVPAVAALFYILYKKDWALFYNPKWLLLIVLFILFILPVVYCYYIQYNLHPEKIVRGKKNINGVAFILFNQSIERFGGHMGNTGKKDYLFFLHSFLWAFAPWGVLTLIAFTGKLKSFLKRKEEWLTTGVFFTMFLVVAFANFKLPHYINVVFPTAAVAVAAFILQTRLKSKWIRIIMVIQSILVFFLLFLTALLNGWSFPVNQVLIIIGTIILLAVVFYFIKSKLYTTAQKNVLVPVAAMCFSFFLLNGNFYPQLLTYQGGNELANASRGKINPERVYYWQEDYSSSFAFYTATLHKNFADSVLHPSKPTWIIYDTRDEKEIIDSGYKLGKKLTNPDYEITKLDIKFINPAKREQECKTMVLAEINK